MNYALYVIAGLITLSTFVTIAMIGKPRKMTTPETAILVVIVNVAIITVLVIAARGWKG